MKAKEKIEKLLEQTFTPGNFEILNEDATSAIEEVAVSQSEVDPKGLIIVAEDQKFLIQVSTL